MFTHALRARVKAEVSSPSRRAETAAEEEPTEQAAETDEDTDALPGTEQVARDQSQAPASSSKSVNIVGKLNNLITSDLESLSNGVDTFNVGK